MVVALLLWHGLSVTAEPVRPSAVPPAGPEPKIMTFNAMQMGGLIKGHDNIGRAKNLRNSADLLANDVLVLTEFFYVKETLNPYEKDRADEFLDQLASAYPYRTPIVGANTHTKWTWYHDRHKGLANYNGGVVVLSKWKIAKQVGVEYTPDTLCGGDWYSDKGFAYVRIEPPHRAPLHVVGTHTQSDDADCRNKGSNLHHGVPQRKQQFTDINMFITSPSQWIKNADKDAKVEISTPKAGERVVIAGDLNVDMYDSTEYLSMNQTLTTVEPTKYFPKNVGENSRKAYSFDTERNMITRSRYYSGTETTELLDHVLYRKGHPHPSQYVNAVHHIWSPKYERRYPSKHTDSVFYYHLERNLSDHYAVSNWHRCPDEAAKACTLTRVTLTSAKYTETGNGLTSVGGIKVDDVPIWQHPKPRTFDDLFAEPVAQRANYLDRWDQTGAPVILDVLVLGPDGQYGYKTRTHDSVELKATPGEHTITVDGSGGWVAEPKRDLIVKYTISRIAATPYSWPNHAPASW
ncbi:hypothetical protein ALI144C_24640 [Actinosynnema sp. ALI-1.44]|nr:hypothetical protein ALI144C_24640 [Actinosynnema sp. ALI-1.44]